MNGQRSEDQFCGCVSAAVRWFFSNNIPELPRSPSPNAKARYLVARRVSIPSNDSPHPSEIVRTPLSHDHQVTDAVRANVSKRKSRKSGFVALPELVPRSSDITSLKLLRDPSREIAHRYEILGEPFAVGGFAEVYECRDITTNEVRAAKRVPKDQVSDNILLRRELELLLTLDHPNIVRLFEWFETRESIWLIQELCSGGEILNLVDNCSSREALSVVRQVLLGLCYLHDRGVVHRDIKLENCMFQSSQNDKRKSTGLVKIIDFGLAGVVRMPQLIPLSPSSFSASNFHQLSNYAGTCLYLSPESVSGTCKEGFESLSKCDTWAMGVMTYILLTGQHPFWDKTQPLVEPDIRERIVSDSPDLSSIEPESAIDLVSQLVDKNPENRLSARQALNHPCMRASAFLGSNAHVRLLSHLRSFKAYSPLERVILTLIAYHSESFGGQSLREVFDLLDTDKNGVLSKIEIITGMRRLGFIIPPDIDAILDSIDTDGSGEIDYTEFIAAAIGPELVWNPTASELAFGWLTQSSPDSLAESDLCKVVDIGEAIRAIEQFGDPGTRTISRSGFTRLIQKIAKTKDESILIQSIPSPSRPRRMSWNEDPSPQKKVTLRNPASRSNPITPLRQHSADPPRFSPGL